MTGRCALACSGMFDEGLPTMFDVEDSQWRMFGESGLVRKRVVKKERSEVGSSVDVDSAFTLHHALALAPPISGHLFLDSDLCDHGPKMSELESQSRRLRLLSIILKQ